MVHLPAPSLGLARNCPAFPDRRSLPVYASGYTNIYTALTLVAGTKYSRFITAYQAFLYCFYICQCVWPSLWTLIYPHWICMLCGLCILVSLMFAYCCLLFSKWNYTAYGCCQSIFTGYFTTDGSSICNPAPGHSDPARTSTSGLPGASSGPSDHQHIITFLGYVICSQGMEMDYNKVRTVTY